jgi:hypothetical protein
MLSIFRWGSTARAVFIVLLWLVLWVSALLVTLDHPQPPAQVVTSSASL